MKTIRIIITWMNHVPLATLELPQHSMRDCLQLKARYEPLFAQTEGLGSIIECKKEENEHE